MTTNSIQTRLAAVALFITFLAVYLSNSDLIICTDSRGNVVEAACIAAHGSFTFTPLEFPGCFIWQVDIDNHPQRFLFNSWNARIKPPFKLLDLYKEGAIKPVKEKYYVMETRIPGRYINTYGTGIGITAAPFFYVAEKIIGPVSDRYLQDYLALILSSILTASSAVFIFYTCLMFVTLSEAVIIAAIFAFCTSMWSSCSQSLWQLTGAVFYLSAGSFFFIRSRFSPNIILPVLSSAFFSMAVLCRQTGIAVILCVSVYYLIQSRRSFIYFVAAGIPFLLFYVGMNYYYFGSFTASGQLYLANQFLAVSGKAFGGFNIMGILFSPGRGLFIYSPVLLFSIVGAVISFKDKGATMLQPLAVSVLIMLSVYSSWHWWWGGWSYGYRIISDIIPMAVLLIIPAMRLIKRIRFVRIVFIITITVSVLIQAVGVFSYDFSGWNNKNGQNVDEAGFNSRLWSIVDNEILYYIVNFTEARENRRALLSIIYSDKIQIPREGTNILP